MYCMPPKQRAGHKHAVKATLKVQELTNAGSSLDLEIFADGQKLGDLIMGRGSLYWFGRGRQKRKRIRWTKFAEMMDTRAYGENKRSASKRKAT
jgi:hypothetical protein